MILRWTYFRSAQAGALPAALAFVAGSLAGAAIAAGAAQHQPFGARAAVLTASAQAAMLATPRQAYPAEVLRVIDGDTFEARIRVWPGIEVITKVRLRGVDAPEIKARCAGEQARAQAARDALGALLAQGGVGVSAVTPDKYGGRVLAMASSAGIADLAAALLAKGLVRPYEGGRRQSWCD